LPLIDRDEPRFAEASREMLQRVDYTVPFFNNQFRFDKPPLTYWFQSASYRIFGDNDFGARFPSAIAAAFVAILLLESGRRIENERVGWWAAIIFTLCLQTFLHAKAAVADVWLVLFMTTAHWAGFELLVISRAQDRQSTRSTYFWWIFYLSLALGFLAKGPIAFTPLLTVASIKLFDRQLLLARTFKFVRGLFLTLGLISLWGIPALTRTNGDFFRVGIMHHVVARSFFAMEGHGSNSLGVYLALIPFYFLSIFASFFPWSIKLPWLARKLWRERDKIDNYLIAGAAIILLIFTFVKTKLPHYTLPALPLLALLLGRHLNFSAKTFARIATGAAFLLFAIALIAPPFIAKQFSSAQLFGQSRDSLTREMEFGAVDYNEPSLVWYFRSRVDGFMMPLSANNAAQFMQKTGPRFVILPTASVEKVFSAPPDNWKMFSAHGFNIAKGKHVDLTLVLKPD
jgi:4-amino-4-deoxy-L-arabinose transferase-like glycosyltransferase